MASLVMALPWSPACNVGMASSYGTVVAPSMLLHAVYSYGLSSYGTVVALSMLCSHGLYSYCTVMAPEHAWDFPRPWLKMPFDRFKLRTPTIETPTLLDDTSHDVA